MLRLAASEGFLEFEAMCWWAQRMHECCIPEREDIAMAVPKITAKEKEGGIWRRPIFGHPCAEMKGIGLRIGQIWRRPNGGPPPSFA